MLDALFSRDVLALVLACWLLTAAFGVAALAVRDLWRKRSSRLP